MPESGTATQPVLSPMSQPTSAAAAPAVHVGGRSLGVDAANNVTRLPFNPPKGSERLAKLSGIMKDESLGANDRASQDGMGSTDVSNTGGATKPDNASGDSAKAGGGQVEAQPKPVDGSKPDVALTKQLAASMRAEAKANEAKIAAERIRKEAQEAIEFRKAFESDPYGLLEKLKPGAYQDWTKQLVEGKKPMPANPEVESLKAKIAALEGQVKTETQARSSAAEQAARVTALSEVNKVLSTDDFEQIRSIPGVDEQILEAAVEHLRINGVQGENGTIVYPEGHGKTLNDFAKEFQEAFWTQATPLLKTKSGRAKLRELLGEEPAQSHPGPTPQAASEPMKTVTNQAASLAPVPRGNVRESRSQILARLRQEAVADKA